MQAHSPLDSAVISESTEAKGDGDNDGKPVDETGHTVLCMAVTMACVYVFVMLLYMYNLLAPNERTDSVMFIVTKLFLSFYPLWTHTLHAHTKTSPSTYTTSST